MDIDLKPSTALLHRYAYLYANIYRHQGYDCYLFLWKTANSKKCKHQSHHSMEMTSFNWQIKWQESRTHFANIQQ